jgi:dephospho-CoA kinase
MKHTFGITGSIACGKSTVTKFIKELFAIPIVDADQVARDVVVPGSVGLEQVVATFGKQYLLPDGTLDRVKLGNLVFANQQELDKVNKIMMPLISEEVDRQIKAFHDAGHNLIGYDGALIIEMGNAKRFRPLVVVTTPFEVQLARLIKRNNLSEQEARNRIGKQLSSKQKAKHADFIIETNGTLDELKLKVQNTISLVKDSLNGG